MIEDMMNKEINRLSGEVEGKRPPLKKATDLVKTKSTLRSIKDTFFEEDFSTVASGLKKDVIVPQIKSFFFNLIIGGLERALYGSNRPHSSNTNYSSSLIRTYTQPANYTNYSKAQSNAPSAPTKKQKLNLGELVFSNYGAAKDLLTTLKVEIQQRGSVTVAQLYEATTSEDEMKDLDFTNNYYGWKNLDNAQIVSVYNGYQLILPKPVQLD